MTASRASPISRGSPPRRSARNRICMHVVTIPPGARAKAHLHESHETAIYVLSGEAVTFFGDRLEEQAVTRAGDMFYIPAGVPHLPANLSDAPVTAVIARTDPNEQESVVLLPDLDALVPLDRRHLARAASTASVHPPPELSGGAENLIGVGSGPRPWRCGCAGSTARLRPRSRRARSRSGCRPRPSAPARTCKS